MRRLAFSAALLALAALLASSASADDDLEDLMGGFDDFDASEIEVLDDSPPAWLAALPFGDVIHERVDLSGSVAGGTSYAYQDHKVPHGDDVGRSTSYGNLTRLDLDFFLQLDVELPADWMFRAEGLGWYDFVYRIKGRGNYGGQVLDVYEWQVDTGELFLSGPLGDNVDVAIGRKIVNWGRSDTFRVVDVINPLDNKEPGLVDIEDLRRPRGMLKIDAVSGPWSGQFLVIPETRYDRLPPPGSEFLPTIPEAFASTPISGRPNFDGTPGLAAKVDGRFSGWDLSIYGSYVDETGRVVDANPAGGFRSEANRYGMLGVAGNVTRGAWLLKAEFAWKTGLRILRLSPAGPPGIFVPVSDDKDRIDSMVGIEYYGPDSLTIALEVVNRTILEYPGNRNVPDIIEQSVFETGLRISRPFFRERLDVTLLTVFIGERAQDGGLLRFSGDWEITDSWKTEGGILIFFDGPDKGLGALRSSDRLFAEIKYSF